MASLRAPPSYFQLRLGRGSREFSSSVFPNRLRPPHRRIRLVCAAGATAIGGGQSDSCADGTPGPDSFSGWSDQPDSFSGWSGQPEISGPNKKGGLGGILGAGLIGIFLASGVTFASLYLKSRTTAGVKQQMKCLTTEQEVLPSFDDQSAQNPVRNGSYAALSDKEGKMKDCNLEHEKASKVPLGKVVVPPVVDQAQEQALTALQVLKVIEDDVQPGDLCTRREYARWLVAASSSLSRNTCSKVYPAMYLENVTELAFDDVTPEDPDFAIIQGLAEAGLISSKLSSQDSILFSPESPLSRQDLVSWKMALEKQLLPEVDRNLYQCSGFLDIDKINPDAWPALVADLSAGDQSITSLAFGFTRLFRPNNPVTKAQAAIALASGDAAEAVSDELARIEAESLAETAVNAHTPLVDQVEQVLNASYKKDLAIEREKLIALEKLAEEARLELEKLRTEREDESNVLMSGRAAVEAEREALSRLRHEVEQQLLSLMSDKMEIFFEKDRIRKLTKDMERENQVIARLEYELEVERKALSMARCWAEEEAKRARVQTRALEEAMKRWEKYGFEVIVDEDLQDDVSSGLTWFRAWKLPPVEGMITRAEKIVEKLEAMAAELKLRSNLVIKKFVQKIVSLIRALAQPISTASNHIHGTVISKARKSVDEFCDNASGFSSDVGHRARRAVEDCREGLEIIKRKFMP